MHCFWEIDAPVDARYSEVFMIIIARRRTVR